MVESNSTNLSSGSRLDELRKKFIVDENEYSEDLLETHIEKTLKHAVITQDGKIIIKNKQLTDKAKVGMVMLSRCIGNKLDQKIPENVSIDEIVEYTGIVNKTVRGRLSDLMDDRFIIRVSRGVYRMNYLDIDKYLETLE